MFSARPWMGHLSSLSLSFFICKMEQVIAYTYIMLTIFVLLQVQMSINQWNRRKAGSKVWANCLLTPWGWQPWPWQLEFTVEVLVVDPESSRAFVVKSPCTQLKSSMGFHSRLLLRARQGRKQLLKLLRGWSCRFTRDSEVLILGFLSYWNGPIRLNSLIHFLYTEYTYVSVTRSRNNRTWPAPQKLSCALSQSLMPKANHYSGFYLFLYFNISKIIQSTLFCVWLNTVFVRFNYTVACSCRSS